MAAPLIVSQLSSYPSAARPSIGPSLAKSIVTLACLGAALTKHQLFAGIAIGDVLLAVAVSLAVTDSVSRSEPLRLSAESLVLAALVSWALFSAILNEIDTSLPFSWQGFVPSFFKLIFYVLAAEVLRNWVTRVPGAMIARVLMAFVTVNFVLAMYVATILLLRLPLPHEFLWLGLPNPESANYFRGIPSSLVRLRGYFSEPAAFSLFQVSALAYLKLVTQRNEIHGIRVIEILVTVSVILSFSLSGYGLLLTVFVLSHFRSRNFRWPDGNLRQANGRYLSTALIFLCLIMILVFSPVWSLFQEAVLERIELVRAGRDVSALGRLVGSWQLPLYIINISPVSGAGLGNLDLVFPYINRDLSLGGILEESPQGWNAFAYFLGALGVPGLGIILLFSALLAKRAFLAAIFFFVGWFSSGNILEPFYWIFFAFMFRFVPVRVPVRNPTADSE